MEDIIKNLVEKISSYDILNNLFPGVIFCSIVERTTRLHFLLERLGGFVFILFCRNDYKPYGSIFIEKILKSIKVRNKKTKEKDKFLKFAPYGDYIEASEANSFIKVLNETNNTYRTIIAMLVVVMGAKLYDWLLYDLIDDLGVAGSNSVFLIACLLITMLFIHSYKKQTDYIRGRVEKYVKSKQIGK